MISTRIIWSSPSSLLHGSLLILLVAVCLVRIRRRLKQRHPNRRVWFLFLPKAAVALLLLMLFFDPAWVATRWIMPELRFLIAIDDSTSMTVIDRDGLSRSDRADRIAARIERRFPDVTFERTVFSDRLAMSEAPAPDPEAGPRETDLAQVLVNIDQRAASGRIDGVVVLTDGGDERFEPFRMPASPLYFVAIGNDPGAHADIAIHAVDAPVFAEVGADIECRVSLRAYGDAGFLRQLGRLRVDLREQADDGESWLTIGQEIVDLRDGAATVTLAIAGAEQQGERTFQIRVDPVGGELTHLNNVRRFSMMVEERHWRVLLYARRLGRSVSELRRMLSAEPGMTLTALLRLRDDHYVGQADPSQPLDRLESFPESAEALRAFRCLVIGAFPADEWTEPQMRAVEEFVADGGSVILLGGDDAFGRGGYAGTPLQPLFPWVIRNDEPEPVRSPLEVGLAPAIAQQGMIPGWAERMREAHPLMIHGMNRPGRLRAGAIGLLEALHDGEPVPVIAFQPYGRGRVMGMATDTMWRWRLAGREARAAYDHFWSSGIRFLAGQEEGGRFLRVAFDRDTYHPGERAAIRVQVPGDHPEGRVRVRVEKRFGDDTRPVPLTQRPGATLAYIGHTLFMERGEHEFTFSAWLDHDTVETFTRRLWVGSRLNEGANIYVDHAFLDALAARGGQSVIRETELEPLFDRIDRHRVRTEQRSSEPLVQYRGIYLLLIIGLLAAEWIIRRRWNLL